MNVLVDMNLGPDRVAALAGEGPRARLWQDIGDKTAATTNSGHPAT